MAHLVLAEESSTVQKVVELCFSTEDIQVHCFSDGKSTLEYMKTQPVDVLLAEVSGPELDGYDLCRYLKQDPETAHVPVILLVGPRELYDAERAFQAGCDGSLSKPLRTLELVKTVKELLSSPVASLDRFHSDSPSPVPPVEAAPLPRSADVFSLTPLQCRATPFPYTRDLGRSGLKTSESEDKSWDGNLLGKEKMDLLVDRLVELIRRDLPGLLREVPSD
ncbi:MAG: response regulator [Acidobacteriota bacterium]